MEACVGGDAAAASAKGSLGRSSCAEEEVCVLGSVCMDERRRRSRRTTVRMCAVAIGHGSEPNTRDGEEFADDCRRVSCVDTPVSWLSSIARGSHGDQDVVGNC